MTLGGYSHQKNNGISEKWQIPPLVISSGGSMPFDSNVKNRYSFDESRNLSCVRDYRAFPPGFTSCNTAIVIYPGDFSTPSHIRFLCSSTIRRLPPLEMTRWGKVSFFCKRFSCIFPYPKPVISSGGRMPYDTTVKNRYSSEESRNLSCVWECRAFPP